MYPALTAAKHCPNCQATLPPDPAPFYCWHCGQETHLHEPTFVEFVHEFVGHYVALDGSLWRTLRMLALSPGRLTAEYFVGRRRRYVLPLRLYLTASFVFFLLVKVFGTVSSFQIEVAPAIDSHGRPITAAGNPAGYQASINEFRSCVERKGSCSWARTRSSEIGLKAASLSEHPDEISSRLLGLAPYIVFALLPVFAAIVMLAYRSRGLPYGAHFVFSLHTHTFWFLWLTLLALLPDLPAKIGLAVLPLYALLALHRVYHGLWRPTLARFVVVAVLYGAALVAALFALGIGSMLAG
jgi:hypothetical protein